MWFGPHSCALHAARFAGSAQFPLLLANLKGALALHFAWYNFLRVHSSLRARPAMEAGITDHVRSLGEILEGTA